MRRSFDFVTAEATSAEGFSIADTVRFHAFNPLGLVAEQRRIDDAVRALVEAGTVKSGCLIAYGSLDHYHHDALYAFLKVAPKRLKLDVIVRLYGERNTKAAAFVAEHGGVVAAPVSAAQVIADREALLVELAAQADEKVL